jgi:SPP1 family predicted phage head-tail adaptor
MPNRNAGSLDRRISILRAAVTPGPFNEPVTAWETVVEVAAGVADVSAGESYRAAEVGAQIGTRFLIRWSPAVAGVDPTHRVSYGGREYNITAVRDIGRQRWREIDAVARAEA